MLPIVALPQVRPTAQELAQRQQGQESESDAKKETLWAPRDANEPQKQAYNHPADRLLYGGAAGGGKSSLLLGVAITQAYESIIFRREYPQLKGLIDDSKKILSSYRKKYNTVDKVWRDIPGGRMLEFGAVQHEDSKEKYQGRPHDFVGFDELTHFTRTQFDFLTGWNRSASGHRCRIIASCNPPTSPEGPGVKE